MCKQNTTIKKKRLFKTKKKKRFKPGVFQEKAGFFDLSDSPNLFKFGVLFPTSE